MSDDGQHALAKVELPDKESWLSGRFHFRALPDSMGRISITDLFPGAAQTKQVAWFDDGDEVCAGKSQISEIPHLKDIFIAVPIKNLQVQPPSSPAS